MNGLNRKLNFARKTRHSKMGEAELEANLCTRVKQNFRRHSAWQNGQVQSLHRASIRAFPQVRCKPRASTGGGSVY